MLASLVRLSRPHFLVGGALMFAVGATHAPSVKGLESLLALVMVLSAQLTAHFLNEYADFDADVAVRNRTAFSGGSGVLPSGALPRRWAFRSGAVTTALCLLVGAAVATFSPLTALLGLIALAISWVYSMPPVRLLETGWGELATSLTIGGLVPLIGLLAQGDVVIGRLWPACLLLIAIYMNMLLAFELPDMTTDVLSGKRVLASRLGRTETLLFMTGLSVTALLVGVINELYASAVATGASAAACVYFSFRRRYRFATFFAVLAPVTAGVCLLFLP